MAVVKPFSNTTMQEICIILGMYSTGNWIHQLLHLTHLAPGRCGSNLKSIIFETFIENSSLDTNGKNSVRWIPQDFTNESSSLVQVMTQCCQATSLSLYLNQCWLWSSSMRPYGVTRPQWVKHWSVPTWPTATFFLSNLTLYVLNFSEGT